MSDFFSITKATLLKCISILHPNCFMSGEKALCSGSSLDLNNPFITKQNDIQCFCLLLNITY